MSENVLILGATSGIARALCHVMSQRGCRLILAGRDERELNAMAADLRYRYGAEAFVELFQALDFDCHAAFIDRCIERFDGDLRGVVLCYGDMIEQAKTQTSLTKARRMIDVNFTSAVSILIPLANYLAARKGGYIVAISSVAGERGRQSNYTYGAAKAALSAYLQGLRNRLYRDGVDVLTIKPGFVDTSMTQGLINPNSPLVASPERVARDIDRGIRSRQNVIFTPWFWRGIMMFIRIIPESIFKRLKL